jgi:hypothetical protein
VKDRQTDYYRTDAGPNTDLLISVAAFEAYQFELQGNC